VLGGVMDLVKAAEVFHFVQGRLAAGKKTVVANHNLHSLYLIGRNADVREFFDLADLTEVDSVPLIFWTRLIAGRSRRFHRCTYLDWRDEFWAEAVAHGWRVFFVGGAPGVGEVARQRILGDWPDAQLATHHGYFDPDPASPENAAVIERIRAYKPDILFVGMGMPRQEIWVAKSYDKLPMCAIFTVGGAFDYEGGVQTPCPRWIGQLGLEWLFRLCMDPRRLFKRYCLEPCFLLLPALSDLGRAFLRKSAPITAPRSARPTASASITQAPKEAQPLAPRNVGGLGSEP